MWKSFYINLVRKKSLPLSFLYSMNHIFSKTNRIITVFTVFRLCVYIILMSPVLFVFKYNKNWTSLKTTVNNIEMYLAIQGKC